MGWKVKKVPASTNNLMQAVVNDLLADGHSASRINVQGQYDANMNNGMGGWRPSGSRKGALDISATLKPFGKSLWVDVKSGKDRLSKDQIKFIAEIKAAGGLAITVKDKADWDQQYAIIKMMHL